MSTMFATLTALFKTDPRWTTEDDVLHAEWDRLLEEATSSHERDEINDVFGRATAA
jgi:hypothetical protein